MSGVARRMCISNPAAARMRHRVSTEVEKCTATLDVLFDPLAKRGVDRGEMGPANRINDRRVVAHQYQAENTWAASRSKRHPPHEASSWGQATCRPSDTNDPGVEAASAVRRGRRGWRLVGATNGCR